MKFKKGNCLPSADMGQPLPHFDATVTCLTVGRVPYCYAAKILTFGHFSRGKVRIIPKNTLISVAVHISILKVSGVLFLNIHKALQFCISSQPHCGVQILCTF
ncbi:UNVERIFIED_CONTAM: hypothetical protein K2H54_056035 [Gekko kuhli]